MTTLESQGQPGKGELKLNLNLEQPTSGSTGTSKSTTTSEEKTESKSESTEPIQAFKQILSSLKDTQKYLPDKFNNFIESMEGKSMEDLKNEAMHLANKAQEEAKKKTTDAANYGKASLDTARSKAQDVMDMASQQTSTISSNLTGMVQQPLQPLKDTTTNLANRGIEMAKPYAEKAQTTLKPYAERAKEYLPEPAKNFVEENIQGKSLEQLRDQALSTTRTSLLGVENPKQNPSVRELVGEVKGAIWTGKLIKNALSLTERAVESVFGPMPSGTPPDAGTVTRVYNLTKAVGSGTYTMATTQLDNARLRTMNMMNQRMQQAKDMAFPYVTSLPIIGRYVGTGRSMTEDLKAAGSDMQKQATAKANELSSSATKMGQTAASKANELMEEGSKKATELKEQGSKAMAGPTAGEWLGKEKMGPTGGASQTSTSGGKESNVKVDVKVGSNPSESGLKQFPSGGMGSVSLGGTSVTQGSETSNEPETGGKKKHGKQ